ncbi:MAG TPA: MFS transporter [Anaerolineae bacterium]|nr:MFS transporter [Anaerolineae bacterium]
MANNESLKEYYKYDVFAFLLGFGGTVWGGMTYFLGIPVAFLAFLNASSFQIGLITAIFWAGFAFPQIWAAYASESMAIKKRFIAWVLLLSSLGFLAAGIYIAVTGAVNQSLSIWLFLILFAWACVLGGLYIPANFTLLFKIIPSLRLGQLLGIMFAIQFGGIFVSGFAISTINRSFAEPMNYAVLFILTFFITIIACLVMFALSEPEGEAVKSAPSLGAYIGKLITIYRTDKLFSKFIVGKWLMSGHYVVMAFLFYFFLQERGIGSAYSAWPSALNGLGLFIGGWTITKIADVYGPKYMLITSQIIAIIYTLMAWFIPSTGIFLFIVAFIITGLAQISDNVGYTNMSLFCCPTVDKSTYVAAVNIGIILPMIFLPMIMGKLMDWGLFGFNGTFAISIVMMLAAIIYILTVVENPKAYVEMKSAVKQ